MEKACKKEADGAQMVLEDKNRLLKEAELLDQLFDSYGQVLSHLKEKTAEKAKYELMKCRTCQNRGKEISGRRKKADRVKNTGS